MQSLRVLLHAVISERPPNAAIDEFIGFCRTNAAVLIRKRVAAGRLSLDRIALSVDDLALDAVADLFSRSDDGRFPQLDAYLRGIDMCQMDDAELMSHIRRLVFAKVNQGIFRMYHDLDPSLNRIIRNIKLSINTLRNFDVVERFGEPHIRPAGCDSLEHLPPVDPEALARGLGSSAAPDTVPALLAALARGLRAQDRHSRLVSLVQVALVFRSRFAAPAGEGGSQSDGETAAMVADATEVIARSCRWVKERARGKYVATGKVTPEMFDRYFVVLEATLVRTIVDRDAEEVHYYQELARLVPGLTKGAYCNEHRSKIEYLGRIAHRRALNDLKKAF